MKFLSERYFIKKPRINITKPIILDFSQTTKTIAGEILRDITKKEYYARIKQVIRTFRKGSKKRIVHGKWQIWFIEESQDLIGRWPKKDDDLATAMNCGRNYKISFVYLTQRIAV